ncbi:MAG: protein kinase family protein, partial [Candidatus Saccharimonadales bacterium]
GPASDIYSLGATLYFVLAGAPPFEAADLGALLQQVQRGEFRPPRQMNHTVPPELDAICRKAMALQAEDRYPSALTLAGDLEHWLADEPVSAYPESAARRLWRWARRHRSWTLSGAAALLLISVVSATAAVWIDHERRRADDNAQREAIARGQEAEQRKRAEHQARVANALRLAAQSREILTELPQRSLLLAVEAVEISRKAEETPRPEAQQMLRDALGEIGGRPLPGHRAALWTLAISRDGRWLVTGSGDQTARLWDLANDDAEPRVLRGHTGAIWAAAFSADGHWLATAGEDKTALLWSLSEGEPAGQAIILTGHSGPINALAFSADGRWLATASNDQSARLWDLSAQQPGESPKVLAGHAGDVNTVAFSHDGRWLATAGNDQTARL